MPRPKTGNKHERLIAAAANLFAEKGFAYTTTAEVSDSAGVAAGTLYLYFSSKDELLYSTLEAFLDALSMEVVPGIAAAETRPEKLEAFISGYLSFVEGSWALSRVFFVELCQNRAALREAAGALWDRYYSIVRMFLTDEEQALTEPTVELEATVATVLGPVESVCRRWLQGRDPLQPTDYSAALYERTARIVGVDGVMVEV